MTRSTSKKQLSANELPQNQRERLNYLDFRLYFTGQVNRSDLTSRFGISDAAATRDLASYREFAPDNIELDPTTKTYRITRKFLPAFVDSVDPRYLLRALVHGIGDDFGAPPKSLIPCSLPTRLHAPNVAVLAAISRSIFAQRALRIDYVSQSSSGTREIVPFALAGNGLRWHARAFDRKKGRFGDFVVNRIKDAELLDKPIEPFERSTEDQEWNRQVRLELVPHPGFPSPEMVELEHGMQNGLLAHETRAALAGYLLRLWNVDCSTDHRLDGIEYQLWLRNSQALVGVDNAKIAPGFDVK